MSRHTDWRELDADQEWPETGGTERVINFISAFGDGIIVAGEGNLALHSRDIDAVLAAVRERDATIARVRDRIESVMASDDLDPDGYQVAGLIGSVLDPQEGR